MANVENVQRRRVQEHDRKRDLDQLEDEAVSRQKRIEARKRQRAKQEAAAKAKRRARMVKMSGIWAVLIVAGFVSAAWFSDDFSKMLDGLF